ncbi:uncharacterized protein STEHIDRAFT_64110, partial [Stereum hirsutum FP-91666 SS1]|uniref:uncharacterized protein n=1 Tax=Stereum hirsutum (strain FP-91666) TaxID=721885 RepID=UPI00044499AE
TIDVHRLKVPEAVRETEKAIRDLLVEGGDTLRVVTGRDIEDVHDAHPIPVLKLALIRTMEGHKIATEVDPSNPGVLIIHLPNM